MKPLIGLDLGAKPTAVLAFGTFECPVLLDVKWWPRWDAEGIAAQLKRWRRSKRGKGARIYCEDTFSGPAWLRDVGRQQEAQAACLQGLMGDVFERVSPVNAIEASVGWQAFGRPEEGRGAAGEHARDAMGIALKGLIRQSEQTIPAGGIGR